jgi:hypothetical protein
VYRAASDDRLDILGIRTRMNPIHEMCEDSLWRPTKTEHIRLEWNSNYYTNRKFQIADLNYVSGPRVVMSADKRDPSVYDSV